MIADLRFAARQLRRSPGFAAAAIVTLALGIGACTAAYSLARGLLWRPLPFPDADRIVVMHAANPLRGISDGQLSYADLRDLRDASSSLTGLAALAQRQAAVGSPDGADRVLAWLAEPSFFPLVGVAPALGRTFRPDEGGPGAEPTVVLSWGYWTRRFGRDSSVIGGTVSIDGVTRTVIGVMPADFRFLRSDLWLPLVPDPAETRDERGLVAVGRLKAGATMATARAGLETAAANLAAAHPVTNRGWTIELATYREDQVDTGGRRALALMLGAVALVLLIACANVAGLMLARGAGRARELAVRAAIGATRGRLLRQALVECALLAVLGAALGVGLASWSNDLLLATLPFEDIPAWFIQSVDGTSLGVTAAIAVGSVFLFGLLPALRASRPAVVDMLKGSAAAPSGTRARSALVVTQVGLAVTLLAGAALFSQSFIARQRSTFGFDDRPIITARVFFGAVFRRDRAAWMRDALNRVRAMPGVSAAALTGAIPGDDGGDHRALAVEGSTVAPGDEPIVTLVPSSDAFPEAIGVAPLSGRWFTAAEAADRNAAVAVVGAGLAQRLWPGGNAIGHRLRALPDTMWLTVVGIARDLQWEELGEDGVADRLQLHVAYGHEPWRSAALMVRAATSPAVLAEPLRLALRGVSSDVPVFDVRTMSAVRSETSAGDRVWLLIFGALGVQALLMTAVGLYGLLAYNVAQRRREIGVRIALGARPASVVQLVVSRALVLTIIGLLLGLGGAFAIARVLASILWGVQGTLAPVSIAGLVLLLTGLAAAALPARRAAQVDPMVALRSE